MKTRTRLLCLTLTLLHISMWSEMASGQQVGDDLFGPAAVQPFMGDLNVGWPGRVWLEANLAEDGLGYEGSYATMGIKTHLFQDFLDGRWLTEMQGHVSAESGGFFANLGIERVFSLYPAGADISVGAWLDYDDDQQGDFAHTMTAAGISGSIKTQKWDIYGNGYFPLGTSDYAQGDPTGANCFLNNSIVVLPGIDSAMQGFDALLQLKPAAVGGVNGTFGIGGYGYSSDLVEFFGGVRVRAGMQLLRGMIVNVEANHDNRFDFTGVVQLAVRFGGSARGTEYGLLGRDLEPTLRNDHIVRVQQDLVLAMDPDTGRPYNVFHVNNLADPAFENGTVQNPFSTLKAAEAASGADDIIFVREGDGTTHGMDQGIVLKDGQLLLGDGVQHIIPIQYGVGFVLCNDIDGVLPTITNMNGGNAVDLASRNTVRGFVIDGSQGGMLNGISGNGFGGAPLANGIIEDVQILGSPILHGIFLNEISGDWRFARNDIQTASFDGIHINDAFDRTSRFTFEDNIVSNNLRDGIHMEDYDGTQFTFLRNTTDGNARDGLRLARYIDGAGVGARFDFLANNSNNNLGDGIALLGGSGNLRLLNSTITGNVANGLHIVDFTNPSTTDQTFIGTTAGGTSTITGNGVGAGAGINIDLSTGTQVVNITGNTVDNNGIGILASSSGALTTLNTNIIDNLSVSGNSADGMRFMARSGSSHFVTVENTGAALAMAGNGSSSGSGMSFFSGDSNAGVSSLLQAVVQNVNMTNTGTAGTDAGFLADVQQDGQLSLTVTNSTITTVAGDAFTLTADTNANGLVNRVVIDNVTATGIGTDGIDLTTGNDTFFDLQVTNSSFTGGTGDGLRVTAAGDDMGAAIDNRTRILAQNNTFTGFGLNGIALSGTGDAHLFAQIDGNTITGNTLNGIDIATTDSAVFNGRLLNNSITGNGLPGLDVNTAMTSTINLAMINNNISGNDTTNGVADMNVVNAAASTMCLSMSNNFFVLPALVTNNSGGASFILELDGSTNGVGVPTLTGTFTFRPFGSTCEPAIAAEEAAFEAAGFPPLN